MSTAEAAERQILAMVLPFGAPNTRDDRIYEERDFIGFVARGRTAPIYRQHDEFEVLDPKSPRTAVGAFRHFAIVEAWEDRPAGLIALGDFHRSTAGDSALRFVRSRTWIEREWGLSPGVSDYALGVDVDEVSLASDPAFGRMTPVIATGERAGELWTVLTNLTASLPPEPTVEVEGDWIWTPDGLRRDRWKIAP